MEAIDFRKGRVFSIGRFIVSTHDTDGLINSLSDSLVEGAFFGSRLNEFSSVSLYASSHNAGNLAPKAIFSS